MMSNQDEFSNDVKMSWMLQASNGTEADRWVNAVYAACTASHVRHHGRANTLRQLKADIDLLDVAIQQVCHVTPCRNMFLARKSAFNL